MRIDGVKEVCGRIKLDIIKVPRRFRKTLPYADKIADCYEFYRKNQELDKPVVVNTDGYIIDGYVRYLVAKMVDLKEVDAIVRSAVGFSAGMITIRSPMPPKQTMPSEDVGTILAVPSNLLTGRLLSGNESDVPIHPHMPIDMPATPPLIMEVPWKNQGSDNNEEVKTPCSSRGERLSENYASSNLDTGRDVSWMYDDDYDFDDEDSWCEDSYE